MASFQFFAENHNLYYLQQTHLQFLGNNAQDLIYLKPILENLVSQCHLIRWINAKLHFYSCDHESLCMHRTFASKLEIMIIEFSDLNWAVY